MKKKIMAALLAGVMLLQQPVSGWCAQNTELTQKSEARQESESSEDTADGSEEDTEATGTATADDGENSQEEDSEDVPTLQAETDEVTLDTGTSDNAPEGQRKILDHIYAESVDLSGMTQEEAQEALQTRVDEITGYQIVLHMDDMSTGVTAKELGVTGDNDGTIRQAMDVGQVGNVIKRYKVKKALEQENLQLDLSYQVDEESVRKALETYCVALNREVVNYELTRENGEFKITNGARGVTLNEDGSVDKVTDYLEHVWKDGPGSVDLDVEITEPKGSQEELAKVKDVLGQGVTDYSASSAARATNVKNGTSKLNGKVLYPGEEISVCDNMVPFTEENGYEPAASYANGTVVESFGGGICQVSTTLYQAVLQAELEVTERHNHSMIVKYVEPSMDAAIAGNYKDLKFKNNLDAPVYIEGYCSGGIIYFNVYGKETRPSNREISFESETVSKTDPKVQFTMDASLTAGSVSVTQSGQSGCIAQLWKIVKVDGKQQSRDLFNKSNYQATPKLITIGTKDATSETLSALKAAITIGDEAKVRSAAAGLKTNAQKKEEEQKEEEKKDDTDKKEDADKSDTNKKEDSSKKDENNKKEDTKKEDSKKQDTKKETTSSTNTSTKKTQSSKESE